jgi:hypothetical protein
MIFVPLSLGTVLSEKCVERGFLQAVYDITRTIESSSLVHPGAGACFGGDSPYTHSKEQGTKFVRI